MILEILVGSLISNPFWVAVVVLAMAANSISVII